MYQYLTLTKENGIAVIQFQRPQQLNAMNRCFMDEIAAALQDAAQDAQVGAIIITGSGRAFMAGADIKEYAAQTDAEFVSFQNKGKEIYEGIGEIQKPVIAAVNGFALGGGFELCLSCDLIVAGKGALFGLPEVKIGLVPGGGGTQRLIEKVGMNRVKEILMLGGSYSAETMQGWGVVNYVVEDEAVMSFAEELAQKLMRRSAQAVAALKYLAQYSALPKPMAERRTEEVAVLSRLYHTPQAQQLIHDFAEKSKK